MATTSGRAPAGNRRVVLRGGAVYTPVNASATALCADGDTVVWVGDEHGVEGYLDNADEVHDLRGRLVTPAFVDAHVHLSQSGLRQRGLDLAVITDKTALLAAVERHAREHADAQVILGYGWDETGWVDQTLPSAAELDRAAGGRTVFLSRVDGHSALVSGTLLSEIDASLPGWSARGRVDRAAHPAAREAVHRLITPGQRREALRSALTAAASVGIGAVHEMSAPHINPPDELAMLREIAATEPVVTVVPYWGELVTDDGIQHARELGCVGAGGDLCADGALGSRTAALCEDYTDAPGHRGHLYLEPDQVRTHVVACTRAGLQAGFHCIGDAAVDAVIRGFRAAAADVGVDALRQARHRLEHAELCAPWHLGQAGRLGLVVSAQPAFDAAWGGIGGMYAARLGRSRVRGANPLAGWAHAGVRLAFGSDAPVTPLNPWAGVRAAVHHQEPDHRLDLATAFAAHTEGGWWAAGRGGGVLVSGAAATYAVWEDFTERSGPVLRDAAGRVADLADPQATGQTGCVRTVVAGVPIVDRLT